MILIMKHSSNQNMIVQMSLMNRALDESAEGITITDYTKPDNFIIYVNAGFERLTRYAVDKIIGKNCRFLQGLGTDQKVLDEIHRGLKKNVPLRWNYLITEKTLLNFGIVWLLPRREMKWG